MPDGVLVKGGGLFTPLGCLSNFGADGFRPDCGLPAAGLAGFAFPPKPKVGIDLGMLGI